jgi:hypothetical protein
VSEYQYYDFCAIDRPLTRKEMAALRSISTRAAITATSFTNHYERGDLKANPSKLLEKYFDVFVYVANWGTHEFCIRLPQESVDYKLLKAMVPGGTVQVRKTARFVIVEFGSEAEWDGEDDGTGWMSSLMPLRSDHLVALGYSAVRDATANEVMLDEQYVPLMSGRRLRALGSASDQSQLVAAYSLALAATAQQVGGKHPGFVIMDEPQQQNPDKAHRDLFAAFLTKELGQKSKFQTLVFTWLGDTEISKFRKQGIAVLTPAGEHFLQAVKPAPKGTPASSQAASATDVETKKEHHCGTRRFPAVKANGRHVERGDDRHVELNAYGRFRETGGGRNVRGAHH